MPFRPQGGRWCPVPRSSREREAPDRAPSSSCIGNASRPVAGLQLPAHALPRPSSPSPGSRRKPWFRDIKFPGSVAALGGRDLQGRLLWTCGCLCGSPGKELQVPPATAPRLLPPPASCSSPVQLVDTQGPRCCCQVVFSFFFSSCKPWGFCPVPSLTYSSPLHLAGSSCAGICGRTECLAVGRPASCVPAPAGPAPASAGPAPLRSRPAAGAAKPALPLSRGGCASPWGNLAGLGLKARLFPLEEGS